MMKLFRGFVLWAVVLGLGGGLFVSPKVFAARGGSSGVITPSLNGTVVRTNSGEVFSITYTATSANGEIAIFNWPSTSPPSSSLVWEGRVATANNSYNHTFVVPLVCPDGIVVQVGNGQGFIEFE